MIKINKSKLKKYNNEKVNYRFCFIIGFNFIL